MIDIELIEIVFVAVKTWEYGTKFLMISLKWCPFLNKVFAEKNGVGMIDNLWFSISLIFKLNFKDKLINIYE